MALDIISLAVAKAGGGGGGEPTEYLKKAQVDGNTLTLTKKDGSEIEFTPQGGGEYAQGDGILIEDNEISIDKEVVALKEELPTKTSDLTNDSGFIDNTYHDATKQNLLSEGSGIKITADNKITYDPDILSTVDYVDGSISDTLLYVDQQDASEHAGRVAGDNLRIEKSLQATKTSDMTQEIGIDSNGKLWTTPGGHEYTGGNNIIIDNNIVDLTQATKDLINNAYQIRGSITSSTVLDTLNPGIYQVSNITHPSFPDSAQLYFGVLLAFPGLYKVQMLVAGGAGTGDLYVRRYLTSSSSWTAWQGINGKEEVANKVTTISASSTDTQYPSAKAVYDYIQGLDGSEVLY